MRHDSGHLKTRVPTSVRGARARRGHANRLLTPPGGCFSTKATRPRPCRQSRRPPESPWTRCTRPSARRPTLFRLLIEMAISGSDRAVPAEERDYVRAIREEADAARKLHLYAGAVSRIQSRLAPLFRVLQGAAPLDPGTGRVVAGHRAAPGQEHAVAGQGAGGNRTPPAGPLGRQSGRHYLEHEFVGVLSPPGRTARLVGRRVRALAGRRVGSVIAKDMSSRTR